MAKNRSRYLLNGLYHYVKLWHPLKEGVCFLESFLLGTEYLGVVNNCTTKLCQKYNPRLPSKEIIMNTQRTLPPSKIILVKQEFLLLKKFFKLLVATHWVSWVDHNSLGGHDYHFKKINEIMEYKNGKVEKISGYVAYKRVRFVT